MTVGERKGQIRVVDYLVDAVASLGVRHIFGVDGANIEDLYDAIHDSGADITGVVAKHEFSAATMADGYARSTSGIGVVAATSGGGAMNLVSGLAEAYTSRVPVVALVGQVPTSHEGLGGFQDSSGKAGSIDALALFSTISRYCAKVDNPEDIAAHFERAVAAARTGGPAVLLLPKDIQQALIDPPTVEGSAGGSKAEATGLEDLARALTTARSKGKVVVIAGDQVARDDARDALRQLALGLEASVGVAPDAKDVYAPTDHGFCGVAGTMGNPELVDAIRRSELCLLVGTRMPVTARAGLDEALAGVAIASIGAEAPYLPSLHATTTDLAASLASVAREFPTRTTPERVQRELTPLPVPPASGPGIRYRDAVAAIDAILPDGSDVYADAGNTGASVVHHLPVRRDGRFVVALGMGGMGYAFGAGIGSAFARGRRTFVIAGDGAFFMHGMEVHTAIEHQVPVTFVIFNNNAHAMCVTREQIYYGDRYSFNRFQQTHIGEGISAMFPTLPAFAARTLDELNDALHRCSRQEGPSFIAVDCDPDEIPPFAPFLKTAP